MIREIYNRWKFWRKADRLGPDIPLTHWRLHFQSRMIKLCKQKFHFFADNASIRPGCYIVGCSNISIGKRVVIRPATHIHGTAPAGVVSVRIEDDVLIGAGVHIYVSNHAFKDRFRLIIDQGHDEVKPVIIQQGAWIGANAIILPGVTIGYNSVVAAGAVVTKSIPAQVVAGGSPARILKEI